LGATVHLFNIEQIEKEQKSHHDSIESLAINYKFLKKMTAMQDQHLEERIRSDLESLHTDDILLALIGFVWIIFGSFFSTFSLDLFKWLK